MLETASIAGGATIAVFLVVIVCIAAYIHFQRKQKETRARSLHCQRILEVLHYISIQPPEWHRKGSRPHSDNAFDAMQDAASCLRVASPVSARLLPLLLYRTTK
ncbi:hypothetical protein C0J52_24380 [Blattella germanica]|nr:hypothetical protein C0J52_24380 [Blattella germanica]